MGKVRDVAEALWRGEIAPDEHPWMLFAGLEELDEGIAFVSSFCNVIGVRTDDGLVAVDTGSPMTGAATASMLREWIEGSGDDPRVHTVVYTHGHVDHVMGADAFESAGPIRVIGHERVVDRFDRYRLTAGYNGAINQRQFRLPGLAWPTRYRYPDVTYARSLSLTVGGTRFELSHDRGETDDHTWVWLPERRVLCTGDLFIWASPNCGNPQKVQRYPREWAAALRKMAALDAALLLPGHGPPILGADRVRQALTESAELLETLVEQTLAWMNDGAPLDVIAQRVQAPPHLLERPYLRPVYDEPEFVVRNLWRLYGGWWDGDPSTLKPAPATALADEVAELCGGARRLARRARDLSDAGEHRLACHLAEMAGRAAPWDDEVRELRAAVYRARRDVETSLMAKSVYRAAAEEEPGRGFEEP
ncbi:MAG TPA: alkyl sulfatase dimerization domain-containing protein [Sandaracinaceae bacterium LLY-WYZ-13_1]|nr:alkyl sulfatase dimerization domain-containing protein [Sandaracinaceae bacterium LLY-WYZ-13_1]